MDNTGLTLSSTGQLKLQSTDSIIIGGSPFGVGGTNFVKLSKPVYFSNNNYKLAEFYLDSGLSDGETVTISAKIALASGRTSIDIYNSGTSWENLITRLLPSDKGSDGIYRKTVPWKAAGTNSIIYLYVPPSGSTESSGFYWIKIEKGTMATDWSPAPSDPASGVKTSSVEVNSNGIYMDTTGEISMNAGTTFKVNSGTVQIEAGDASNSSLRFGDAFSVNKEGTDYKLAINSKSDNAIMINSNPVWHKGNLVVSKTQPPTGNETVWIKPGSSSGAVLKYQNTITSNVAYAGGGSQTIALANQTGDTSTTAGTYTFSVTFTLRRFAVNQRVPNINTTGGSVVLSKGGANLTLGAIPSLQFGPWHDRTVTVTGSTTNTAFASTTGDISCVITIAGTPAYGGDDFIAHARPSLVSCTINAPGSGGSVQPCELFFVP
jgi:hypothetical protein